MNTRAIGKNHARWPMAAILALGMAAVLAFGGCAAYNPQGAAIAEAPTYYNQDYASLTPQQKMQLEDHLANQSNNAWRTTAAVTSSVGSLAGGTGLLMWGIRR